VKDATSDPAQMIAVERKELQSKMNALTAFEHKRLNGGGIAPQRVSARTQGAQSAKAKVRPLKGKKADPKYRGQNGKTWAGHGPGAEVTDGS
jgi:DNA-binding protein H-NS